MLLNFRNSLKDQAATFATISDVKSLEKEIRVVQDYKIVAEGKASQTSVNIALLVSVLGLIIGGVALIRDFIH